MQLQQEEDIRQYIEARLQQKGIKTQREVACGNGIRADLVTSDMVIEVKRRLNRGAIYQAYGQGVAYQKLLKKPKLLIIGLAPTSESKYQEAQRIAENIRTKGVEVVFIDKDPSWGIAAASVGGWWAQLTGRSAPVQPVSQPVSQPVQPVSQSAATQLTIQPVAKPTSKPTARLPFEPVQASITGDIAEKVAEKVVEKAAEKIAEKSAEKTPEASPAKAKPPEVVLPPEAGKAPAASKSLPPAKLFRLNSTMKDFWILLLIIVTFVVIKTYLERSQPTPPRLAPAIPPHQPTYLQPGPRFNPAPTYRGS
ncbi:MAG: hypothetical protein KME07_24525 [Pegethrix bostrychoides GSE-TBD4-15B]|jgi:hypothetical protein|uniref:Uncharacterized protein n=1 Tax=Pegethrix bostrychoides GSE-TBD4-15B TaxID=2839662 RepID=A0A951PGM4_9CYAN|nr:hypothetical protein [Pegethrix bostrychoides GSE-TBD4-15B]